MLPSLSDATEAPAGLAKTLTGISGFDDITMGGVPTGRPTLVCGAAGCGKTLFATTFLVLGATQTVELLLVSGRPVVEGGELRTVDEALVAVELARETRRLVARAEARV